MNTTPDKPREESTRPPETTPKPITESRQTIFDRQETVAHAVEWKDTSDVRLHDVLDIAFPELTPDQCSAATDIAQRGDRIAFDALADTITDSRLRREVIKASALALNRGITGASLIDRVRIFFAPQRANAPGIGLARALRWLGANTGRTDLRVVYPASGSDRTGFLDHIGRSPVSSVDCVTGTGPHGADERARIAGKNAREIIGNFNAAITDGQIPPESVDCLALDSTGIAALSNNELDPDAFVASIRRTLAPGGIAVVTLAGDMVVAGLAEHALNNLPPEEFQYIGAHGDTIRIIERKKFAT